MVAPDLTYRSHSNRQGRKGKRGERHTTRRARLIQFICRRCCFIISLDHQCERQGERRRSTTVLLPLEGSISMPPSTSQLPTSARNRSRPSEGISVVAVRCDPCCG